MNAYRKLLVLGVNELLQRNLIALKASGKDQRNEEENGHIFADLGGAPSVILWENIGVDELRVSVWWNYDHSKHPQANNVGNSKEQFMTASPLAKSQHYRKFVGATVSSWLERRAGLYIQGIGNQGLFKTYMRRSDKAYLNALPSPKPDGYSAEGRFHM